MPAPFETVLSLLGGLVAVGCCPCRRLPAETPAPQQQCVQAPQEGEQARAIVPGQEQDAAVPQPVEPGQEQVSPTCVGEARPIDQQGWQTSSSLVVLDATTCLYRVMWNGWDPPRPYEYHPDGAGWIGDYFISGSDQHGQVFWNVITGDVRVRPRPGQQLTLEAAQELAQHAFNTIFPGIDLDTLHFDPRPCPDQAPCTPY